MRQKSTFLILSCLFSMGFVFASPSASYASSTFVIPSSNYSSLFATGIYSGCLFKTYNLNSFPTNPDQDVSVWLGANSFDGYTFEASPLSNCSFALGTNGNFSRFNTGTAFNSYTSYNGDTVLSDVYSPYNSNFNGLSNFNSFDFDFYNSLRILTVRLENNTGTFTIPAYPTGSEGISFSYFAYAFDIPEDGAYTGLQFKMVTDNISSNNSINYSDYINDSIVTNCSPDISAFYEDFPNLFPNFPTTPETGYNRCYVIGTIPQGQYPATFSNNYIQFLPKDNTFYSNYEIGDTDLSDYGYPWFSMFYSPSYKSMGAMYDNSLKIKNHHFEIVSCTTVSECAETFAVYDELSTLSGNLTDAIHLVQNNNPDGSFNFWDNIFSFNILNPFDGFFGGFISPAYCASIPTIASWLNTNQSIYCSWWSPTVINTLTPVFTVVTLMVLFGFIVSWLRGDRAYSVFHSVGGSK